MPGPGERIGDAYIRIHASGGDLGKEVREGLRDVDVEYAKAGGRHADLYERALTERVKKTEVAALALNAQRNARRVAAEAKSTGDTWFGTLRKTILDNTDDSDVGFEMVRRLERQLVLSGGDKILLQRMFGTAAGRAKLFDESLAEVTRLREAIAKENDRLTQQSVRSEETARRRMETALIGLERDRRRRRAAANQEELRDFDNLFDALDKEAELLRRNNEIGRRGFERSDKIVIFNRDLTRLGDTMGRVFGRGSRSEFLNFFGRLTQRMTGLLFLPARIAGGFVELTRSFMFAGTAAGGALTGFKRLTATFRQLGLTGPKLVGALAAVPVAFAAIFVVIGPLIAGLSLLAGVATALASTISFALMAALGSLVAILLPLGAGLAVLAAGIVGMDDATKKMLKNAVQPLVTEFKALGEVARKGLLSEIEPTIRNLGSAFQGLRPLVRGVSEAMADVGLGFAEAMNSAGFRRFRDEMANFLPGAVRRLGNIFRQTLGGIGGLFVGMIPFMRRVLRYLDDLTQRFSDWANSAKGQSQIESFFKRAGDSAKRLGGFLKEVGGLIGDLFSAGRGTGDNLFKSMENAVARFRAFIKSDPDILREWFASAQKFGEALGRLVIGAGRLLDALDNASSRGAIVFFTDLLAITADLTSMFVKLGKVRIFDNLLGPVGNALRGVNLLSDGWNSLKDSFKKPAKPKIDEGDVKRTYFAVEDLRAVFESLGIDADLALQGIKDDLKGLELAAGHTASQLGTFFEGINRAFETGAEGKDKFGLGKPFRDASNDLDAFVNRMRSLLGLPPIPIKLDRKQIIQATIDALAALDALNLLRVFNGRPKVDKSQIKAALNDILSSIRNFGIFKALTAKPKVNKAEIKAALNDILAAIRNFRILKAFTAKPRVNKSQIDAAKQAAAALLSLLQRIKNFGSVGRNANSGHPGTAVGGIFGGLGPNLNDFIPQMGNLAHGGFANFAQSRLIGESGREAVVPLDRPLSLVDPSVRALAAFAQGKLQPAASVGVDASGWTIVTPASDASAVANKVLDRLTAAAY